MQFSKSNIVFLVKKYFNAKSHSNENHCECVIYFHDIVLALLHIGDLEKMFIIIF